MEIDRVEVAELLEFGHSCGKLKSFVFHSVVKRT